jgi:AraC-like DNA-binding protein
VFYQAPNQSAVSDETRRLLSFYPLFEKNFNDFINEFRVQIFLQRVKEAAFSHYSLLSLAYDCGFNSKSTFNRAVKKITGQQPSDFLAAA